MDRASPADLRIARARHLAREHSASAEVLSFYAELAGFQQKLLRAQPHILARAAPGEAASFAEALDHDAVALLVPELLSWLHRTAPSTLADVAEKHSREHPAEWQPLIEAYWTTDGHDVEGVDETRLFIVEALLQPFAERLASTWKATNTPHDVGDAAPLNEARSRCPICHGRPVVATLHEQGHGARRSLVCALCLAEWPTLRIVCPACGENGFDALPVYRADEFAGVRIDACETCHTYIKTIDLAVNGVAIPIVDDLASLPLDLWAREQGYQRIRPNLLRI